METALVRARPAAPRQSPWTRRSLRLAVGVAVAGLMVGAALMQPFGGGRLFPGRPSLPQNAAYPPARPLPPPPAVAPIRPPPVQASAPAEPPATAFDSHPTSAPPQPPAPQLSTAREPTPPRRDQTSGAPAGAALPEARPPAPAVAAAPAAPARLGAPPPPREPLPLQTDLIDPIAPSEPPGAGGATSAVAPASDRTPTKPPASDRHG